MENPFSDLPTDTSTTSICKAIEINLNQLSGEEKDFDVLTTDTFYIM